MKRQSSFIIVLVILFFLFLYFFWRPVSYELKYDINKYNVTEKYNKKEQLYYFTVQKGDQKYEYVLKAKYNRHRKLISQIKVTDKKANCLSIKSKYLKFYDLCLDGTNLTFKNHTLPEKNKALKTYENVTIYNLNNRKYLLWNYHNFLYLNGDDAKTISLFTKDYYNLKLSYGNNRYLFIPNQKDEYTFRDGLIIDSKNGKVTEINFDRDLYFDSYYLGSHKNNLYLVDRKNKEEYALNLKQRKLQKIAGQILKNDKWEKVSMTKLINKDYAFTSKEFMTYVLKDDNLYAQINDQLIFITSGVTSIIENKDYDVYFVAGDSLYYFNLYTGFTKLLSYSEWQYNTRNMIYLFD